MSKRSRDRQLAKLAARRQAERDAAKRRRGRAIAIVTSLAVLALLVVGGVAFLNAGDEEASASATGPSGSPSASPSNEVPLGARTGSVDPQPAGAEVACGADVPGDASTPKPQFHGPPPRDIELDKIYVVTLQTSCGDIVFEMDPRAAPDTVNSFVFLVKHRYFDGQYFHRIATSIDVIQSGDPTGVGTGGPGYAIPDELSGGETYGTGAVAMANTGQPNTGGSQFFIIVGKKGHNLDTVASYTVFGRVTGGMDIPRRIFSFAPATGDGAPTKAIYIERATVRAVAS